MVTAKAAQCIERSLEYFSRKRKLILIKRTKSEITYIHGKLLYEIVLLHCCDFAASGNGEKIRRIKVVCRAQNNKM